MAEHLTVPLYDVEKAFKPTTVCVTGGTGYIAGPIIQRLLAAGHTVHATCRNPDNEKAVGFLKKLPGAKSRLTLFKADLLEEGSFLAAVKGCSCVMHTASPYTMSIRKGKEWETVIGPAVKGTENVIDAVNKTKSVKRLVLTSSCGAVCGDAEERGRDHVFTENDWNLTASEEVLPYFYSKRLAEEKAIELCKDQNRWDLVSMLPVGVFGPPLSDRVDSSSVSMIKQLVSGGMYPVVPKIGLGVVDVRDVAAAHCVAMSDKKAKGRYLLCASSHYLKELGDMLRPKYPGGWFPRFNINSTISMLLASYIGIAADTLSCMLDKLPLFDNGKATTELGLKFLEPAETLDDMVKAMLELGILKGKNFRKY
ncbi:hypothetical protein BSKO_10554 [Bryopsis sp. KO-2023]|nr:hypothetical protein BSKO_10554 [Bryopsis sp. KO-2023]